MRGDVDMALEINKESVEFLEGAASFEAYSSIQPFYIPLVFNLRNPILARLEVRRAISDAIDRDEIVSQGMRERGQVADDPDLAVSLGVHRSRDAACVQPQRRPRCDSTRPDCRCGPPTPGQRASRFQLKCMFYNGDPQFERIALAAAAAAGSGGHRSGARRARTSNEMVTRLQTGQFDSYLFQLTSGRDVTWAYRFWHSPNGALGPVMQNTGYSGADAVLDRLRQARDGRAISGSAVGDLRQRFYDDVPAVFLAWTQTTRAVDARFDIGDPSRSRDLLANI